MNVNQARKVARAARDIEALKMDVPAFAALVVLDNEIKRLRSVLYQIEDWPHNSRCAFMENTGGGCDCPRFLAHYALEQSND